MSDFGNVPTFDYITDVFAKAGGNLAKITELPRHPVGAQRRRGQAGREEGERRRHRRHRPQQAAAAAAGQAAQQPSDLVILFDAEGAASTMAWIVGEIRQADDAMKAAPDPTTAQATILAAPKFRGYFATSGSYWAAFHDASHRLKAALRGRTRRQWRNVDQRESRRR